MFTLSNSRLATTDGFATGAAVAVGGRVVGGAGGRVVGAGGRVLVVGAFVGRIVVTVEVGGLAVVLEAEVVGGLVVGAAVGLTVGGLLVVGAFVGLMVGGLLAVGGLVVGAAVGLTVGGLLIGAEVVGTGATVGRGVYLTGTTPNNPLPRSEPLNRVDTRIDDDL